MRRVELAHWRLHTVGLTHDLSDAPTDVVGRMLAIQSQDFGPALWSIAQRLDGVTQRMLMQAFDDGAFLRTHVLRPTWHFVLPEDLGWLLQLTAPRVHALNAPYYRRNGLDDDVRACANVAFGKALAGGRSLTRTEIASMLADEGIQADRFNPRSALLDRVLAPHGEAVM
ncbi:MAG: DNA glycosylase AlkZ-like family protein [Jiangellaceae bacterium]